MENQNYYRMSHALLTGEFLKAKRSGWGNQHLSKKDEGLLITIGKKESMYTVCNEDMFANDWVLYND